MQTKLHQWAIADPGRCFDDVFNLVYDPAFLTVAWRRVRGNKGARTAGVDGVTPCSIVAGAESMLNGLRDDLKARRYRPERVRQKTIPKSGGKVRSLGIPTVADRVVQSSLKAGARTDLRGGLQTVFISVSVRSAELRTRLLRFTTSGHPTGTTTGCSRQISRRALMRSTTPPCWGGCEIVSGTSVFWGLVKAFLKAGVLTEDGSRRATITGTPQGGILSPLLANIALSVLDEHFTQKWENLGPEWTRAKRRRAGEPVMKLVRYADDFVVMVHGTREDAEALWDEVAAVLAPTGLRLSEEKTRVCHIDEVFDFLGWRIQRRRQRGRENKMAVYTYPSEEVVGFDRGQGAAVDPPSTTSNARRPVAPGSTRCCGDGAPIFRHGVSKRTFGYIDHFAFWRVAGWLKKRHLGLNMHTLVRRHLPGWEISDSGIEMFRPNRFAVVRYRYRGTKSLHHGQAQPQDQPHPRHEHMESRMQ